MGLSSEISVDRGTAHCHKAFDILIYIRLLFNNIYIHCLTDFIVHSQQIWISYLLFNWKVNYLRIVWKLPFTEIHNFKYNIIFMLVVQEKSKL